MRAGHGDVRLKAHGTGVDQRGMMKKISAAVALFAALSMGVVVASALGKTKDVPPINYGVADDTGKYADDGGAWFDSMLVGANLTQARWTLSFDPTNPTQINELAFLQRAAPRAQADGVHVVLALYGRPATAHDPVAFCAWAALVANTVKGWGIHDFIVWNEPNTALYWSPQDSTAPAAYEALLATCYDSIHAADSSARVIAMGLSPRSNGPTQTAPMPFIAGVAAAYKASGRTTPIMDQMSIHPYPNPNSPTDSPDVGYGNTSNYGVPNLDRVKQAIYDGFNGTGQPTTVNGLTFRIDELGWQTDTTLYSQYYNQENVKVVSEQTQAAYIARAIQKYLACDPTVTDVEWFLLVDEATRNGKSQDGSKVLGGGWQSGLLTAGGQGVSAPKVAYSQDAALFAAGRAACTSGLVSWTPVHSGNNATTTRTTTTTTTAGSKSKSKQPPICKKGQKSTKAHPCRKAPRTRRS
jgi:polysaccharide biosynthesis protein PslG